MLDNGEKERKKERKKEKRKKERNANENVGKNERPKKIQYHSYHIRKDTKHNSYIYINRNENRYFDK